MTILTPDQKRACVEWLRVEVSRGERVAAYLGLVFPPDDERYLSLTISMGRVRSRRNEPQVSTVEAAP